MSELRDTQQFRAVNALTELVQNLMDHVPGDDPDELVLRFFESREALRWLSYVQEWDLPPEVRAGLETFQEWLEEEHAGHVRLLALGRLPS